MKRASGNKNLTPERERFVEPLLCAVIALLQGADVSNEVIQQTAKRLLRKRNSRRHLLDVLHRRKPFTNVVATALSVWHRQPEFLDDRGRPKPLPLVGRKHSVSALLMKVDRTTNVGADIQVMKRYKLLKMRRDGRYLPSAAMFLIGKKTPYYYEYLSIAVTDYICAGMDTEWLGKNNGAMLHRQAFVPDLPASKVKSFRDLTFLQGDALLRVLDDWLETNKNRRGAKSSKRTSGASVHIVAHVSKPS